MYRKEEYIGWQFVIGKKVIDYLNDDNFDYSYNYRVESIIEEQATIVWAEDGELLKTTYSFDDVKKYFEDGSWVLTDI